MNHVMKQVQDENIFRFYPRFRDKVIEQIRDRVYYRMGEGDGILRIWGLIRDNTYDGID